MRLQGVDWVFITVDLRMTGVLDTDLNCDGVVGGPDVGIYQQMLGAPVGPSGLICAGNPGCTP